MAEKEQDGGIAAALAGLRAVDDEPPAPRPPSKFSPEDLAWVREQVEVAFANGIEEGANRVAAKYGTYGKIVVGASIVTALSAVGILIAVLVKGD